MIRILNHADLQEANLPDRTRRQVEFALSTLLDLSGGHAIDNEYGYVLVLEGCDRESGVLPYLDRPFADLLFEGVVYRNGHYHCYLAGGGNECLVVLISAEGSLTATMKAKLQDEL